MAPTSGFPFCGPGATITLDRALAEAFSHKPLLLSCEEDGTISNNVRKKGLFLCIDKPVDEERDLLPHPRATLEPGAEFLTKRPLRVRLLAELGRPDIKERRGQPNTGRNGPEKAENDDLASVCVPLMRVGSGKG